MKKILIVALAAMSAVLVSCSQKETLLPAGSVDAVSERSFNVLEENEISGAKLFSEVTSGLQDQVDPEVFEQLLNTFRASDIKLAGEDPQTKAIVPALYKTARVEYQTLDQDNQPVTASALIVYPLFKKIKEVMLINHGTHIGFMLVPTKYTSVEAIMAATGALCILPDYIGLGSSAKHPDLYLNHEVHGRTSVDALLTLLDFAKAKKLPLDSNYKTTIFGYSQGGSVSLASLRRVQELDAAVQDRLHLQHVYCGEGPYDLRQTFESYIDDYAAGKKMGLGAVIPLVINSMFNSYPSEVADMNYEDFFTPWALSTGVPQHIRANKEGIIDVMLKLNGADLGKILNFDYLEANPEHLARLLELMDRQNLCHGWSPEYDLTLFHCNPDGVVPFSNFEQACAGLANEHLSTRVVPLNEKIIGDALLQHITGMLIMIEELLADKL